jgi:hypothetical protein
VRRKRLFNNQVLYFQHAPPFTNLDAVSDSKRLKPPFTGAPAYMCSMYYYWWAFLRENDDYRACCEGGGVGPMAKLFADFGDVRDENFMEWWIERGRMLFCEPLEERVIFYPSAPLDHDDEGRVLVSIPLSGDLDRVLGEIRAKLGERRDPQAGASRARYAILTSARLQSLDRQLKIYQLRDRYQSMTKIQIAYEVGILSESAVTFDPNSVTAQVSGYYADARKLVKNIGKGRFPDYSDEQEPELFG